MKETTLTTKKVYECSFMSVYEDDVILPNQKTSQRVYIKHPGGAAMLATTKDDQIILIKQFRYPLEEIIYEIPAGKMDVDGEDFKACAIRELEEETGYISDQIDFLYQIYPCVGYSDEIIEIYRAKQAYLKDHPKQSDEDEFVKPYLYTKDEVKNLLLKGEIKDGKTIIAIQSWLNEK